MPRTVLSTINVPTYISSNGGPTSQVSNHPGKYFFLSRSDIVRNPLETAYWRDPSPYVCEVNKYVGPFGKWYSYGVNTSIWSGNLRQLMNDRAELQLPASDAGLRSKAEVGALEKLKDQKVNLAQAFAERGQIANMFSNNIRRVASAYSDVKKGRFKRAANTLGIKQPKRMPKEVANRWLEYQYGWRPLLGDTHGAIEEFAKSDRLENYRVSVVKDEKRTWKEYHPSLKYGISYLPYDLDQVKSNRVRVRLDYTLANANLIQLSTLGLTNPASLAWEVIPFSFVADWAIPIGDWLSSLDAAFGYNFLGGSITETRETSSRVLSGNGDYFSQKSFSQMEGRFRRYKMERQVYYSSPIPTLPRFKNPWSYGHAANSAALLTQAVKGAKAPR